MDICAEDSMENDLKVAVETLKRGGLILYPTDTVWGIGCDATNSEAVERVYRLKQRAEAKALILLTDSLDMLYRVVENVPDVAEQLIEAAVKPTTIIYDHATPWVARNAVSNDGSVAVRITGETFSRSLCRRLRRPLVSTSANISGHPTARNFSQIAPEIINGVDYVVNYRQHDLVKAVPSMIIKIADDSTFKIIR